MTYFICKLLNAPSRHTYNEWIWVYNIASSVIACVGTAFIEEEKLLILRYPVNLSLCSDASTEENLIGEVCDTITA